MNAKNRTRRLCSAFESNCLGEALLCNPSHDSAWPTVESKQQTCTKQSLPQRYACAGCQLNSDQALRLLCLKGHITTPWRHHWQEASKFLWTKTPLWRDLSNNKKSPKNPGNTLSDALRISRVQNFAAGSEKTTALREVFWNRAPHGFI